jgi:pimeloyl-ACP methyl ester carboxylesterase
MFRFALRHLPGLAMPLLERRFFAPGRRGAALDASAARTVFGVSVGASRVKVAVFGEGPLVILVHGWSGAASQFKELTSTLTAAGYSVACFDAPAHGGSPGVTTNVFEFVEVVLKIERQLGQARALVGHSLGGTAAAVAASRAERPVGLVLVAPMPSFQFALDGFARIARLTDAQKQRLGRRIETRLPSARSELDLRSLRLAGKRTLIIHDRDDRAIPLQSSQDLQRSWSNTQLSTSRGLGHNRILSDPLVLREVLAFVRSQPSTETTSAARADVKLQSAANGLCR